MKTAIYQYWLGERPAYTFVSERLFRAYAEKIGADYILGDGSVPIRCFHKRYFGALAPILSQDFSHYDAVLYCDMDVIPKARVSENIFDDLTGDVMLAEEADQPSLREKMRGNINGENDQKWAQAVERIWRGRVFRDPLGRPRIFNSGVCVYSRSGMETLRKKLPPVLLYQIVMKMSGLPRFYSLDQNYLNAFLRREGVDFQKLDGKWNSQVTRWVDAEGRAHLQDGRTKATNFIHLQHGPEKNAMSEGATLSVAQDEYTFGL